MSVAVLIYGKPECPYCVKAKAYCVKHSLPYHYRDVVEEPHHMRSLVEYLGYKPRTVPQIFIGSRHIGGCDDFISLPLSLLQQMVAGG
jgi:glutaredoxin